MKILKHRMTQQFINLLVFIICTSIILLSFTSINDIQNMKNKLELSIEQQWRAQARSTLADMKDQFLTESSSGIINPNDNISVQKWAMIHLNGVRNGGKTSDGFMLRMPLLDVLWDGSADCLIKDDSIKLRRLHEYGALFRDPKSLDKAVIEMNKLYSTKEGDNLSWMFDDSPEFLEWIMLPNDTSGFGNQALAVGGVANPNYSSILIELGTQKDEVFKPYSDIFRVMDMEQLKIKILVCILIVICVFNMGAYVFLSKRECL